MFRSPSLTFWVLSWCVACKGDDDAKDSLVGDDGDSDDSGGDDGGTDDGGSDGGTDDSATEPPEPDFEGPYGGTLDAHISFHVEEWGYDDDDECVGTVSLVVDAVRAVTGIGDCDAFDKGWTFAIEGGIAAQQNAKGMTPVNGSLILVEDEKGKKPPVTPFQGTVSEKGLIDASYDTTHQDPDGNWVRIVGTFSAAPSGK